MVLSLWVYFQPFWICVGNHFTSFFYHKFDLMMISPFINGHMFQAIDWNKWNQLHATNVKTKTFFFLGICRCLGFLGDFLHFSVNVFGENFSFSSTSNISQIWHCLDICPWFGFLGDFSISLWIFLARIFSFSPTSKVSKFWHCCLDILWIVNTVLPPL